MLYKTDTIEYQCTHELRENSVPEACYFVGGNALKGDNERLHQPRNAGNFLHC